MAKKIKADANTIFTILTVVLDFLKNNWGKITIIGLIGLITTVLKLLGVI